MSTVSRKPAAPPYPQAAGGTATGVPVADVVVIDDHEVVRYGLREVIGDSSHQLVGEAATASEGLQLCQSLTPHVVLLDIRFGEAAAAGAVWLTLPAVSRVESSVESTAATLPNFSCSIRRAMNSTSRGEMSTAEEVVFGMDSHELTRIANPETSEDAIPSLEIRLDPETPSRFRTSRVGPLLFWAQSQPFALRGARARQYQAINPRCG